MRDTHPNHILSFLAIPPSILLLPNLGELLGLSTHTVPLMVLSPRSTQGSWVFLAFLSAKAQLPVYPPDSLQSSTHTHAHPHPPTPTHASWSWILSTVAHPTNNNDNREPSSPSAEQPNLNISQYHTRVRVMSSLMPSTPHM